MERPVRGTPGQGAVPHPPSVRGRRRVPGLRGELAHQVVGHDHGQAGSYNSFRCWGSKIEIKTS